MLVGCTDVDELVGEDDHAHAVFWKCLIREAMEQVVGLSCISPGERAGRDMIRKVH